MTASPTVGRGTDGPPPGMTDLHELIEGARHADTMSALKWRDPIVRHGVAAIDEIKPYLSDSNFGWFAALVIRWAGALDRERALTALCDARMTASAQVRTHILNAVEYLGGTCVGPDSVGDFAPSYMHPETILHRIVDRAVGPDGETYLTECGWFYSGDFLRTLGVPVELSATKQECGHCRRAVERGATPWQTTTLADTGLTYILRSVWHIVDGVLDGPKVGPSYRFRCSRWAPAGKANGLVGGTLRPDEPLCVPCGRAAESAPRVPGA